MSNKPRADITCLNGPSPALSPIVRANGPVCESASVEPDDDGPCCPSFCERQPRVRRYPFSVLCPSDVRVQPRVARVSTPCYCRCRHRRRTCVLLVALLLIRWRIINWGFSTSNGLIGAISTLSRFYYRGNVYSKKMKVL